MSDTRGPRPLRWPCRRRLRLSPESFAQLLEGRLPHAPCPSPAAGPASEEGLRLRSFRIPGGLEASVTLDKKFCAFPGIMNGGIITRWGGGCGQGQHWD